MKNELIRCAKSNNCNKIGFLKARKFDELYDLLKARGKICFCENDIEKRINPFLTDKAAKTFIICLFSYNTGKKGNISSYAHGLDYHKVIEEKLKNISRPLTDNGYSVKTFCDNSPFVERYLASLCGLGFFGKNNMLINEELGSRFFIGIILTNCEIEEDKPLKNTVCLSCNKCIEVCPGGALSNNGFFDENKCASYISQKKGELTDFEKQVIKKSGYVWACDACQDICPYNSNAKITDILEFSQDLICNIDINETMSNKEFKKNYSDRAFSWRGKNVLLRNIEILKY